MIDYETVVNFDVCIDCMFADLNGDVDGTPDCEPWSRWTSEEQRHIFPNSGEVTDDGNDQFHQGFSWSACDGCGSTLGGDRYAYVYQR